MTDHKDMRVDVSTSEQAAALSVQTNLGTAQISRRQLLHYALTGAAGLLVCHVSPVPIFAMPAVPMPTQPSGQKLSAMTRIKVVGVGGGGGNALQHMMDSGLCGVRFICANTDLQALDRNAASDKIQLGEHLTKGLGVGADPAIGRAAALESMEAVKECLADADMVFIVAGMGGGTGTGAAPVIAQAAKALGALTVGVVTKPFSVEGARRSAAAEAGIAELRQHVDCLIVIPNDRLLTLAPKKATIRELFIKGNDILQCAVQGITDVIMKEGLINLDFADMRAVMNGAGLALMGTGAASGENRAREAAQRAITSPLLEGVSIGSAKAVLYTITVSRETDITNDELQKIGILINDAADPGAKIVLGVVYDDNAGDELRITVIAAGTGDLPPYKNIA